MRSEPMVIQAVRLAFFGALIAGIGLAAGALAAPVSADSFPVATDARLGGDETQTRFVVDLSRKIDLHVFTLADPYRVVVDIPQVTFRLPPKAGETGRGLIKAFRFGLVMPGGSRIVLDLVKPARVDKAFVVDPADGAPARLVLDLAATDRESFLRKISLDQRFAHTQAPPSREQQSSSGDARPVIVLDFAKRLKEKIETAGKYRVLLTRSDDTFVPLAERVRFAREAGAGLFISIHADSLPHREGDAQGATVYTLSETATDPAAARLAEQENRADVIAGVDLKDQPDDVADILIDLAQRETKAFSVQFANKLVGTMKQSTRLHKEPIKSAGFRVLRAPDVPSVLVELGYVSNKEDLQSLSSDSWRDHAANAMASAVDGYFSAHVGGVRAGAN